MVLWQKNSLVFRFRNIFLMLFVFLLTSISTPSSTVIAQFQATDEGINSDLIEVRNKIKENNPIEVPNNAIKLKIQAGSVTQLHLQDQLRVNLTVQDQVELCINITDNNPIGTTQNTTFRFGNYYQFELNRSTQMQAIFSMHLDPTALSEIDPQNLSWAFFNNYSNSWEYAYSWLNDYQNELLTKTNHFSVWTILVLPENSPLTPINIQGNGSTIKLRAHQQYQIKLPSGFQINSTFGTDIELFINESSTIQIQNTFENHYRYGNFWTLETNNSLVDFNASFGFPYDHDLLPANVDPSRFQFYYFNTSLNQWQMSYSWVNQEQKMVFTTTNHFSIWTIFAEFDDNKAIEPKKDEMNEIIANGTAMRLENGSIYRFRTRYGFELNISFDKTVELKLNESYVEMYQNTNQNQVGIKKILNMDLNETEIVIKAILAYKIAISDVPNGIDPFKLAFGYFDASLNEWKIQFSWVVSLGAGFYMIFTNTTHFSSWSVFGTLDSNSISTNSQSLISGFEIFALFIIPLVYLRRKLNELKK